MVATYYSPGPVRGGILLEIVPIRDHGEEKNRKTVLTFSVIFFRTPLERGEGLEQTMGIPNWEDLLLTIAEREG